MRNIFIIFSTFLILFHSFNNFSISQKKKSVIQAIPVTTPDRTDPLGIKNASNWIKKTLSKLSLEEKVGQLVVPFTFTYYTSEDSPRFQELVRQIKENKVGGFIFSAGDVYEAAMLANKLQSYSKIPLLISADFERGVAMRINRTTSFPYSMALGAAGDENLAYEMGKITAIEGRALGVHHNYAPVVDLNNNPRNPIINIRSFGEDPKMVIKLATAFIKGTHAGGMISTIKHFPGHGDTEVDSHSDLPVLNFSKERLNNIELVPFKSSIESGAMSVMIAHLSIPALDTTKNLPSTLSSNIVNDLLKKEMNFKGLIVTDAMEMRGVTKYFSTAESSIKAIQAGIDMVLIPENPDIAVKAIVEAVKNGQISKERMEESVIKVLAIKYWLGLHKNKLVDINQIAKIIANEQHLSISKKIAQKAITLLKNEKNLVPLSKNGKEKIVCITVTDINDPSYGSYLEPVFKGRYRNTDFAKIDIRTSQEEFEKILNKARVADLILFPIYMKVRAYQGSISINQTQKRYMDSLFALNKPSIMISFGNPYLIMEFPKVDAYINTYSDADNVIDAALEAIFGEIDITGKTPVTIPGFYKIGDGISVKKTSLLSGSTLDIGLEKETFDKLDNIINKAIKDSAFPGAAILIAKDGIILHKKGYGRLDYSLNSRPVTTRTIFDLASVSKVISTTTAAMRLIGEKKLSLDDPVVKYIPEFGKNNKSNITIRNLLLHNSGLIAFIPFYKYFNTAEQVIDSIYNMGLIYKTGDSTVYSDFGMITLGKVIEKITGKTLDQYMKDEFFIPLGMIRTMYNPPKSLKTECAPTEMDNYWRMRLIQGEVHDENSSLLNGIAGHAGLFSTVEDLGIYMQMLMNGGIYAGKKYLDEDIIKLFTSRQSEKSTRGLGWGIKGNSNNTSAGILFSPKSFGHTGFTGTCVWADPTRNIFVIFLTNRVHPTRANQKISKVRVDVHNTIIESIEKQGRRLEIN